MQGYRGLQMANLEIEVATVPGLVNRIRELRKAAGLNQEQLAERMDVDRTTVSRLENGEQKITSEYLAALATALDRNPIEFISDPADVARDEVEREALDLVRGMHPDAARTWLSTGKHLRPKG